MPKMYRPFALVLVAVVTTASTGCSKADDLSPSPTVNAPDTPKATETVSSLPGVTATVTRPGHDSVAIGTRYPNSYSKRAPNRMGRIPVLEYHLIGDRDALYSRTRDHFRADLEDVYRRGYRPITISQLLDRDFSDVPIGMSPVVVVLDDASPGQFRYVEKGGTLEIDPTSGLGIWLDFAKTHPGWKNRAVFCMLNGGAAGHNFFGDKPEFQGQKNEWRFLKVRWLADNGFELCAHTLWHAKLSKYPDSVVQEQIARNVMGIDSAVPGYNVRTFALPYGLWPKNRELAWRGSWKDPGTGKIHRYHFDAVLEVSGGPTRSPYDPQFDPHHITRIQAVENHIANALDQLDRTSNRFVAGP